MSERDVARGLMTVCGHNQPVEVSYKVRILAILRAGIVHFWQSLFLVFTMSFQSRRVQSLAILKDTGMWRSNYEPLFLRALWRMGVEIPPPHFMPFPQMLIVATAWFSVAWGAIMWPLVWSKQGITGMSAMGISCGTGLFFGFSMAIYYAHDRRKYRLPKWESLDECLTAQ